MPQQLHLFADSPIADKLADKLANESFPEETTDFSAHSLVNQTRQLFHHQGSNAELIERIKTVVTVINERCKEPNLK